MSVETRIIKFRSSHSAGEFYRVSEICTSGNYSW